MDGVVEAHDVVFERCSTGGDHAVEFGLHVFSDFFDNGGGLEG